MMFEILNSGRFVPTDRFTLFCNPYDVQEPHGDFTSITTWHTISRDGTSFPTQQFFKNFRASESLINANPEFYLITCECGNRHIEDTCKECCDHEWDPDEGFMCLNCNSEYPW